MTDRLARALFLATLFLLPWGGIPLVSDGLRSTNPWVQLHFQLVLEGILRTMRNDRGHGVRRTIQSAGASLCGQDCSLHG